MEENNVTNEPVTKEVVDTPEVTNEKKGNKKTLPIIIICVLVAVLLIAFFVGKELIGKGSKNVYFNVIDSFGDRVNELIKTTTDIASSNESINYELSFSGTAKSNEYKNIVDIINKISAKGNMSINEKTKYLSLTTDLTYNNSNILSGGSYIKDKMLYLESKDLYDKPLSISLEDYPDIWENFNLEEYKLIVNKMTRILKDNLKDEYFSNEKTTIKVLDKDVVVQKQLLTMDKDQVKAFSKAVLLTIKEDEKLIDALSAVTSESKSDILKDITEALENIDKEEYEKLNFEVYINDRNYNLEKAVFSYGKNSLLINKISENTYDITTEGDDKVEVGTLEVTDSYINFKTNGDGTDISYKILLKNGKATAVDYNISYGTLNVTSHMEVNDKETKGYIKADLDVFSITVNVKTSIIKNTVKEKTFDNAKDVDSLTQDEMNTIMTKLQSNQGLVELIQDINSIYSSASYSY